MLQIKQLTITHSKDLHTIVDNFTFTLNEGDKAVIISEEGNGKSTLLKAVYDDNLIADYAQVSGEIIKPGLHTGYLPQEFPEQLKYISLYEYCCLLPSFYDRTLGELAEIAGQLHFPAEFYYSDQLCATLSGGEKIKLQMAGLMISRPDVYLLDEPSNDVDIRTLEWLEEFIRSCPQPVLYVSHDEVLIENTANTIIHLEQIQRKTASRYTIARMPYSMYVQSRESSIKRQDQQAANELRDYRKQQEKFLRIQQKVDTMQANITRQDPHSGQLLKKKMKSIKSQERRFEKEKENMTLRPDVEQAIFMKLEADAPIPNGKTILDFELDELRAADRLLSRDLSLRIIGPRRICIIGDNGCGKSTLFRELAQRILQRTDIHAFYMPQDYSEYLTAGQTPVDYLTRSGDKEEHTRIRTYLGSLNYTADEMNHSVTELSGGQKAKLLFLKMSLAKPNVLLLDEPTRNFSPLSGPVIRSVLQRFNGCIISISHDRRYIREVCDLVYEMTPEGLKEIQLSDTL